ncbi:MAG TPA: hypothetical protein VE959_29765 [Bryobacteraceae bacterium]|nr:hypothetical protein [Bryobacteraceae bacterium]
MDWQLIGALVKLRYKLIWAKTRTRNGRIALFFAGYILLVMLISVFAAGGVGAAIAGVRTGKAYLITAAVLGGLYVQALLATVVLGFGVNSAFADSELRRYPLKAGERRFARHFLGILDPFWYLIVALELGLAVGLYVVGAANFWIAVAAVLLLYVSNYLLARVVAMLVERLVGRKGGSAVLLGLVLCMGLLPTLVAPGAKKNPHAWDPVVHALEFTPPAGAAAAMTRHGMDGLYGMTILAVWLAGLCAAVVALERRPPQKRIAQATTLSFESPWDRLGVLFGPRDGPLVAQWLRFYSRNNRFRTIYPLALPIIAFIVVTQARVAGPKGQFANVLGAFTLVGCVGTMQFAVNQFGYLGGGFRRYLLLPAGATDILRAGSYAFLILSAALIPVATLAVALFSPVPLDVFKLMMLFGGAVFALFFMHGVALWSSLYGTRKSNFYSSFGNDLSLVGNIVVIGGVIALIAFPRVLVKFWPGALESQNWWMVVPLVLAGAAFYSFSLRSAGALFQARRERMLAIIEGRG